MKTLFAVTRTRGPLWDSARPLRSQDRWDDHAAFMDRLAAEGIVLLGGPLDGSNDVLLIFNSASEDEIHAVLARDPWTRMDLLATREVSRWTILLEYAGR